MKRDDLIDLIAHAIRAADKRYFFEDYTAQAGAVVQALRKAGLVVAPLKADEAMVEAGSQAILSGRVKPSEHVRTVYEVMVQASGAKR